MESCDYFVVPYAKRKLVEKAIGAIYQQMDRQKFVIVCTARTDWTQTLPVALRFIDDTTTWSYRVYANGKLVKSTAEAAKLLRVDAAKLEAATDAEKFRKLVGFRRYAFTPTSYQQAVAAADGFGEMAAMEAFVAFTAPIKK